LIPVQKNLPVTNTLAYFAAASVTKDFFYTSPEKLTSDKQSSLFCRSISNIGKKFYKFDTSTEKLAGNKRSSLFLQEPHLRKKKF
jgi:hypothetical protein